MSAAHETLKQSMIEIARTGDNEIDRLRACVRAAISMAESCHPGEWRADGGHEDGQCGHDCGRSIMAVTAFDEALALVTLRDEPEPKP